MNKEYMYITCPTCGKKLFKVTTSSVYCQIYIWCKVCKREIEFNNIEPMSRCE